MSGTRQKTPGEQSPQTSEAEGRGEALDAENKEAEPLMAKPAPESPALAEQLMEEVCDRGNLERAWKRVRSNKGSPGVDGMTIDAAKDYLRERWPTIRTQLLEGTYQPQPVKRVEIPKPDGGIRKLGVPCVVDRLIQQAMLQVLQERWDPTFSEHSYGFRPGRSAHQAVAQAQVYVAEGYNVVVDLDLEKFFDRVNHDGLMARVAVRVSDKRVLRVLTILEARIRRRLRLYLWRQWRTGQNRFAELRRRGVAKFPAAVAAGSPTGLWRMSGHPAVQQALRNDYFESLGLPRLYLTSA